MLDQTDTVSLFPSFNKMMKLRVAIDKINNMIEWRRHRLNGAMSERFRDTVITEIRALERALFSLEGEMDVEKVSTTETKEKCDE